MEEYGELHSIALRMKHSSYLTLTLYIFCELYQEKLAIAICFSLILFILFNGKYVC